MKVSTGDMDYVYQKIGMALVSAQRVEMITGKVLEHLHEFKDYLSPFISEEFLANTQNGVRARKTLGEIFKLLKLNPRWVIEDELNDYLSKRNLFVHGFWLNYLQSKNKKDVEKAIDFCYDFGRQSQRIESFFKGFIYFLALRNVFYVDKLEPEFKKLESDFEFFILAMKEKSLIK